MSEHQQNPGGDGIAGRARDLAGQDPETTRRLIDKVEDAIDTATGARFSDQIDKMGDLVEDTLGLPDDEAADAEPFPPDPQAEPTATARSGAPESGTGSTSTGPSGDPLGTPPQQDPPD